MLPRVERCGERDIGDLMRVCQGSMAQVAEVFSEAELQARFFCWPSITWSDRQSLRLAPPPLNLKVLVMCAQTLGEAFCGSQKGLTTLLLWAPWHAPSVHLTKASVPCYFCGGLPSPMLRTPGVGSYCC